MNNIPDRFLTWVQRMFVSSDQFFACWLRGWFYVWGNGELPSADETLSDWVGQCAEDGYRAGIIAEKVIDFFMGAGHCRHARITDSKD